MLQIICKWPTFTEPFIHAEHLQYIRDWKSFITPYLREYAFVGISKPHHFRFYMHDNKPHVQYKDNEGLYYGFLKIDIFFFMKYQMFVFKFP